MPRHYKAQIEHTPMDFEREFHAISRYFRGKARDFVRIFVRWKLPRLAADDRGALTHQVRLRLYQFALDCDALSPKTPRKLVATVDAIVKDPSGFLERHDEYEPQASASVFITFASASPQNRMRLLLFEAGIVPSLPAENVRRAAEAASRKLQIQAKNATHRGGQKIKLRRDLINDLAKIFESVGGTIKLSTSHDPEARDGYRYEGPFHDFLDLVLPPVRTFAEKAGFHLDKTRSMVTTLLKSRRREKRRRRGVGRTSRK